MTADDPADVEANRERLAAEAASRAALPAGPPGPRSHVRARERRRPRRAPGTPTARPPRVPGVAALVFTADCLPIALAAPGAVAMLHAGWRGLRPAWSRRACAALRELGGDGTGRGSDRPGRGRLLLRGRRRGPRRLRRPRPGVRNGATSTSRRSRGASSRPPASPRSTMSALCTMCADPGLFFSHRRDGGMTGRQAGVAWRSLSAERVAAQPRGRARARSAAPGATRTSVEILAAVKYLDAEELGALADGGITLAGREPRPGARGQGRAHGRAVHLGLHRPAAEPQGQADPAARRG